MVDPLLLALAVPVLAAILLVFLRSDRLRRWTGIGSAVSVALVVLLAPSFTDLPLQGDEVLIALLVCAGALADAELGGSSPAIRQVRFAGLLIALLPVHPLVVWLGLALAGSAGAALRWPRRRAVLRHAMAVNVALGLPLFGVAAVQGVAIPVGAAALLLGWGALVLLEPALLPVVMLLMLRTQDLLAGGVVFGTAMVAGGTAALAVAAVVHLIGPRRTPAVLTLAQGAIAVVACGLGGTELRFAGLLHLTLLTLCDGALRVSSGTGLDRAAGLVSLSGLPPFGVFPSLALILFGVAIRMPWLLVPIMAALLVLGWATAMRLPTGPLRPSPAWVPLVLALLLGIAMPAPLAAWFQALAKAAP